MQVRGIIIIDMHVATYMHLILNKITTHLDIVRANCAGVHGYIQLQYVRADNIY